VLVRRRAAAAAAANVPVSHYLAGRLQVPRASVIYNPVARRAFTTGTPGTGENNLIAFAGRLVAEKGLDTLLHALAKLPGVRLEIAGTGPMRAAWEALAHNLGLQRRVRFLGGLHFDGIAALYLRSTVVCVPSACDESFGYAAAEAMAMGCAVVATPRGALPELLGEGRGFVTDSMHPDALAATLARALYQGDARVTAGLAARAFAARRLSIDVIGPAYEDLYRHVSSR
jgi:glycogen(starch) synthase